MADELNNTAQEVQDAVQNVIKEQKKKKRKKAIIIITIIAVIAIAVFAGSGSSKNIGETGSGKAKTSEKVEYEVGEGFAEVWTDSINTKWVRIAVPVKNTGNENLYLSSASFDIENTDGKIADTINMVSAFPQIIKPGETAYYYEETLYDGNDISGLKVIPDVDVKKATVDCIRYSISENNLKTDEYGETRLLGRVENTTDLEGSMVYVTVNYFDRGGKFLSQQFTILENGLKAGAKKGFQTSFDAYKFKSADIGGYEVYAYPDQLQF